MENNTITEDVMKQLAEEVGEDTLPKDTATMLMQKYGLSAPVLTQSEKFLIKKEEQRGY